MKLSIIIPVYITEEDILQRFHLLLSELGHQMQTHESTEIICVDDESPLHPAYPEFVSVVRKKRSALSTSCNVGLDNASGEWVTFLDDDDYVTPDYLDVIYSHLNEKYEYLSWDWVFNDGSPSRQYTPGYRNNAAWGYAFRRDIIGDKRFDPSIKLGGDIDFVKRTINPDHLHKDLPDVLIIYYWFGNENSYTHRFLRGEIK